MTELMMFILCVMLIFMGLIIFQMGMTTAREDRKHAMTVGIVALAASVIFALIFMLLVIGIKVA